MILNAGKDRIVTSISSDMNKGQWGSGTSSWSVNNAGLGTAIADTEVALSLNTVAGGVITTNHVSSSGTAIGSTFVEYAVETSTGTAFNRILYEGVVKSTEEMISIVSFNVRMVD
jgi:hypothetical protein